MTKAERLKIARPLLRNAEPARRGELLRFVETGAAPGRPTPQPEGSDMLTSATIANLSTTYEAERTLAAGFFGQACFTNDPAAAADHFAKLAPEIQRTAFEHLFATLRAARRAYEVADTAATSAIRSAALLAEMAEAMQAQLRAAEAVMTEVGAAMGAKALDSEPPAGNA